MIENEESKMVRRECIASIIDLLSDINTDEDKEENLRRIKVEFKLKMNWSSATVLKHLIAMRRKLDIELGRKKKESKVLFANASEPKLGGRSKVPKLKPVKVQVAKLSSNFLKFLKLSRTPQASATRLKKSPPTLVALLCKGKTKKPVNEKARKRVTWWDGYNKNKALQNMKPEL